MIGHNRTNLERLEYMVIDEAHLVLEKFPHQMRVLMARYHDLLVVNERQAIAQFVLISSMWSTKLKSFIDAYLLDRVIISNNKLEASYFGQTQHTIEECTGVDDKLRKCVHLLRNIQEKQKNTVIFTNKSDQAIFLYDYLTNKLNYTNINVIIEHTNVSNINEIQNAWSLNTKLQILICEDSMSKLIEIDNAQCIIHYDFPSSKICFGNRLWFMRRYFTINKKTYTEEKPTVSNSSKKENINSNENLKINDNNNDNKMEALEAGVEQDQELNVIIENELQLIEKDEERLCESFYTNILN
jgi:superfamily II DNA/RNA helicase